MMRWKQLWSSIEIFQILIERIFDIEKEYKSEKQYHLNKKKKQKREKEGELEEKYYINTKR